MIPFASALSTYETFANGKGFVPTIVDLPGGAQGFWIGDSSLKDVIVHFVGTDIYNIVSVTWRKVGD